MTDVRLPPGACYVPEVHGEIIQKKPRLMLWCDAENCWMPITKDLLWQWVEGDMDMVKDGEQFELSFKRVDMTDAAYAAIPEG